MAKLKFTPHTYAEASEVLQGRSSVKLGNNTFLEWNKGGTYIAVRLHSTEIVKFHEDDTTTLHTGGYRTVTTKSRLNAFIEGVVYQKDYNWYFAPKVNTQVEFVEGMNVA